MILFNITFCVDRRIEQDFLAFLKEHHIPQAEGRGLHSALILRMRGGADEGNNTFTAALQMRAPDEATLDTFRKETLPELYGELARRWGNGVAMFESTLDVLHDPKR